MLPVRVGFALTEECVDYRCARCGHLAQAVVQVGGTSLGVAGVSVSNAALDARVGAVAAARLAACPRCGSRDRGALAKVVLGGAVLGLLAAVTAGLSVAEQLRRLFPGRDLGPGVVVATFLVVVAATVSLKLRSIDRRVRLLRLAGPQA
ncbi:MAG: hypothetical protein QM704_18760 [Anaeromyxobacteraceae bacterium]